jgi:hypothetical protein
MGFDASVLALSALGSYAWSCRERGPCRESKTIGFTSLIGGSLLYTFGARSPQPFSTHQKYLGPNHLIPLAVGAGFVAEVLAVTVPSLRKLLSTTRVGPGDVLLTGLSCVLPQILVEGAKRYSLIQKEKQTWVHSF